MIERPFVEEEPDEPTVTCRICGVSRSIRWYQQSTAHGIAVRHADGKVRWYGYPDDICPKCHKGSWRGPRKGRPGRVHRMEPPLAVWEEPYVPERLGPPKDEGD